MTPEERSLRGKIAAHAMHARNDATETTAKARRTFLEGFETAVDPDGTLPEPERQKRAAHARKAHFLRLALKSVQARRERAEAAVANVSE